MKQRTVVASLALIVGIGSVSLMLAQDGGYDRRDYGVKMNNDGSWWNHLDFHVSPDGNIHVHERLTDDVYGQGWCGNFTFKLSDLRDDTTLFQADSPEACVGGKSFGGHEQTNYADWDIHMDPDSAKRFIAHPSEWAHVKDVRGVL
jgi:hypothetical protein